MENPLAVFQAAHEYVKAALADGTLDCAYALPDGSGASIANVDSHEELWDVLSGYPFAALGRVGYEVYPLLDVNHSFGKSIERLQKMGSG